MVAGGNGGGVVGGGGGIIICGSAGGDVAAEAVDHQAAPLHTLRHDVGAVARQQQPVSRLYAVGETHEGHRVQDKRRRHAATDDVGRCSHVLKGGQRQAPVGYGTPEVGAGQVIPELLGLHVVSRSPPQCRHRRHDCRAVGAPTK